MDRREFLLSGLALMSVRTSSATSARIDILPDEVIGTITPDIYGHFTEHLGGCIYDGIWVGENSKIPNAGGIRRSLIHHLKRLKPPVIRWPGGCFADSYNWRDGVGPRNTRPRRTNFWANTDYLSKAPNGPQKYEPNQFGTNDFVRLCKAVGAEPYFAGNLRSGSARDFYEWIEYCNSPAGTTTLAELPAQGGDPDPFPVRFWGVGNESWGCGGAFTGADYAVEFRRFIEWVPRFGTKLAFIDRAECRRLCMDPQLFRQTRRKRQGASAQRLRNGAALLIAALPALALPISSRRRNGMSCYSRQTI